MPDNVLRVSAEFDVTPIVAGAQQASTALEQLAQKIAASGLSAQETASALQNLGYSEDAVAAATRSLAAAEEATNTAALNLSVAHTEATASLSGFERAAAAAGGRVLGMEAGMGALGGALGRVSAYLPGLGELFAAAFPVAILALASEKIYAVYENVVLLKASIDALNKAGMEEADRASSLNYQYEISAARLAEQNKQFDEARRLYQEAASDKPLQLPKIDDKIFKQFNADFVTFLQAAHSSADAPTIITRIQAEADSTQKQIELLNQHIAALSSENAGQNPIEAMIAGEQSQARLTDLTEKLNFLKTAIGSIQSQSGTTFNDLQEQLLGVGKAAEKASQITGDLEKAMREVDEETKRDAKEELDLLDRKAEAIKTSIEYEQDLNRAMEESLKSRAEKIREQVRMEAEANRQQQESDRQTAEEQRKMIEQETEVFRKLDAAAREVADKEQREFEQATRKIAQDFSQAFNQVITGHERVGQAALKLGENLELYIIDEGIKRIAVKYGTELLTMLAAHSSFLASLFGIQTTADAASIAQAKLLQEQIVTAQAGEAFAGAFASVMESLPFPINVATAPGVAAAAFAQVMAGGNFAEGGIVPRDMIANVHEGEGIFTSSQTENIQRIADNRQSSATSITMENHFHKTSDMSEAAVARMMRRAVKRGTFSPRSLA